MSAAFCSKVELKWSRGSLIIHQKTSVKNSKMKIALVHFRILMFTHIKCHILIFWKTNKI